MYRVIKNYDGTTSIITPESHPALWRFIIAEEKKRHLLDARERDREMQARLRGRFEASREIVREFLS